MTRLSRDKREILIFLLLMFSIAGFSQISAQTTRKVDALDEPLLRDYRGVQIGWLTEDVRKKLGTPVDKSDEQDLYVFNNEKETAQVLYDKASHKVIAISVDFLNGAQNILTPQQVFGADIEAKPDGSKYRLVRYPKAGFWLSYNRTSGDSPMITVTFQRM